MNLIGVLTLLVLLLGGLAIAGLNKRLWIRLTGLSVILIVAAIAGFFLWQFHRWDRGFDQIHVGDSSERVRQIMGSPTKDTDATIGIYGSKWPDDDRGIKGCTEQYWYYPFFTPECWWIALDAHGPVIATYHYISP